MNEAYLAGMAEVLDGLAAAKDELRGVIVTSAKKTFFAGGDLEALIGYGPDDAAAVFEHVTRIKGQLRRLETLGLPVVAALTGTALGGGLEIALACHRRIAARRAGRGLRAARGDARACSPARVASPGSPACSASRTGS